MKFTILYFIAFTFLIMSSQARIKRQHNLKSESHQTQIQGASSNSKQFDPNAVYLVSIQNRETAQSYVYKANFRMVKLQKGAASTDQDTDFGIQFIPATKALSEQAKATMMKVAALRLIAKVELKEPQNYADGTYENDETNFIQKALTPGVQITDMDNQFFRVLDYRQVQYCDFKHETFNINNPLKKGDYTHFEINFEVFPLQKGVEDISASPEMFNVRIIRQIDEDGATTKKTQEEREEINSQSMNLRKALQQACQNRNTEFSKALQEFETVATKYQSLSFTIDILYQEISKLYSEQKKTLTVEKIQNDIAEDDLGLSQLEGLFNEASKQIETDRNEIVAIEEELKKYDFTKKQTQQELMELQKSFQTYQQNINTKEREVNYLKDQLEKYKIDLTVKYNRLKIAQTSTENAQNKINKAQADTQKSQESVSEIQKQTESNTQEINKIDSQIRQLEIQIQELNTKKIALSDKTIAFTQKIADEKKKQEQAKATQTSQKDVVQKNTILIDQITIEINLHIDIITQSKQTLQDQFNQLEQLKELLKKHSIQIQKNIDIKTEQEDRYKVLVTQKIERAKRVAEYLDKRAQYDKLKGKKAEQRAKKLDAKEQLTKIQAATQEMNTLYIREKTTFLKLEYLFQGKDQMNAILKDRKMPIQSYLSRFYVQKDFNLSSRFAKHHLVKKQKKN